MNPDLTKAVAERIQSGYSKEAITQELVATGYTEEESEAAIKAAFVEVGNVQTPDLSSIPISAAAITLPSFLKLLTESFNFVFRRADLLIAVAVVSVVLGISDLASENPQVLGLEDAPLISLIIDFAVFGVTIGHFGAIIYMFAHSKDRHVSYMEGLRWLNSHVGSVIWLGILIVLILATGVVLFIVPAIIMFTYLAMSYLVLARKDARGLDALMLSRYVVRGHWWGVFWRQVCISIILFVGMFWILISLVEYFEYSSTVGIVVVTFTLNILSVAASMVSLRALAYMYSALEPKLVNQSEALAAAPRMKYTILAWCGLVAIPALFFIVFTLIAVGVLILTGGILGV